jgi:hypothetical protein
MDAAGNTSNIVTDDILYDGQAPTASGSGGGESYGVTINGGALWTTTLNVTLNIHATDNIGVVSMNISNTTTFVSGNWQDYQEEIPGWTLLDNNQTTKNVYVKFRDAAGNESSVATDYIWFDKDGPFFPPIDSSGIVGGIRINNGAVYTSSNIVDLEFLAAGADEMLVSNDTSFSGSILEPYKTASSNWPLDNIEGTRTVYVRYQDLAGNTSNIGSDTIILDWTPPSGRVTINSGAATANSAALALEIYATDNYMVAAILINETGSISDGAWQNYNPAKQYNLADTVSGDKTIYVWLKDGAGNISNVPVTDDITLLDIPPPAGSTPGNGGTGEPIWSYPNPFSPSDDEEAKIGFLADKDGWVKVYIYNIRGERVWSTETFARQGAANTVIWNGRTPRGAIAPNGIYILFLTNEQKKITGRGRLTLLD